MITAEEILKSGGSWLGAARGWMQRKKLNGSRVTWGSQEALIPTMTVQDVEQVAAEAAAAERTRIEEILVNCAVITPDAKERLLDRIRR